MIKLTVQAFADGSGPITVRTNPTGHYIALVDEHGDNLLVFDPAYTGSLIAALQQAEQDCNGMGPQPEDNPLVDPDRDITKFVA